MFLPAEQACSLTPNSQSPDPNDAIAQAAEIASVNNSVQAANLAWLNLLTPDWTRYIDQGPLVAYQLRQNNESPLNAASLTTGVIVATNPASASLSPLTVTPPPVAAATNQATSSSGNSSRAVPAPSNPVFAWSPFRRYRPGSNPASMFYSIRGRTGNGFSPSAPGTGGSLPAVPIGVQTITQGNSNGSNPAAGGDGGQATVNPDLIALVTGTPSRGSGRNGRRGSGSSSAAGLQPEQAGFDPQAFAATFGTDFNPVQTYTGPLPEIGSSMSLVVGGQNRSNPVAPGILAGTPDPRWFGSPGMTASCPAWPQGVISIPLGEPDSMLNTAFTDSMSMATGPSNGSSGVGWIVAGILALAAVAYMAPEKRQERRSRKKAGTA